MRRLQAWITGAAGGLAAYRLLRRRHEPAVAEREPEPDPRAEELRAKLAETRTGEAEAAPEPAVEESPDERRRRVHEQARGAIDEMQGE